MTEGARKLNGHAITNIPPSASQSGSLASPVDPLAASRGLTASKSRFSSPSDGVEGLHPHDAIEMGEQWEDVMQDVSGAAFPSPSLDTFPDLRSSYRPWDPHSSRPTEPTFQPQSADVPELPTHGPYLFEPKTVGDHWEQLHQAVENYDHEMCTSWREEIDTLLVFAGLFTAIVTAFTVESYKWLQPEPVNVTNQLLLILAKQVTEISLPSLSDPSLPFTPSPEAVRINCFWFLSITISLAAGVIGILCKQWMREYQRDAALPAKDALALRQIRYIGWKKWGMPHIISLPAIFLQISLLLFLGGLTDLLWNRIQCMPVALAATIVVATTILAMCLTTVLPLLYFLLKRPTMSDHREHGPSYHPPFKSPQSYLCLRLWDCLARCTSPMFNRPIPHFQSWLYMERKALERWVFRVCGIRTDSQESAMVRYRSLALQWIEETLAFNNHVRNNLAHCLIDSRIQCEWDKEHYHMLFQETRPECAKDNVPHRIFGTLFKREHFALYLEILLRQLVPGSRTAVNVRLSEHLFADVWRQHRRVPPILARQTLLHALDCIGMDQKRMPRPLFIWHVVFTLCLESPTYDDIFGQILHTYCQSLVPFPDSDGHCGIHLSTLIVPSSNHPGFTTTISVRRVNEGSEALRSIYADIRCCGIEEV